MSINGISTNYSAYDTGKTKQQANDKNFAKEITSIAQADGVEASSTLHGSDEESGDSAVLQVLYTNSGLKYTVYKTQDFNSENPIYKVKIWDTAENMTERMIDASKINPKNCDTFEMDVYAVHLMETGKGSYEETVSKATMARGGVNSSVSWDYSKNVNWVEMVKNVMQSAYDYGDLKGYMEWKKFLSFLE